MGKKFNFIVGSIVLVTVLVFGYLIYFNIKKNTKIEVNGFVKETGINYVVVEDDNNEYLLNTNDNYNVGDKVNVILKNVKKGEQYTGEIIQINILSRNVKFSITDVNTTDDNKDNINSNVTDNANNNTNTTNSNQTIANDAEIIAYFNEVSSEIDNNNSLKDTIKEKFVMIVDFLFYEGEIKGRTFDELSNSTKLKVLEIFLKIDNKIDNKFPGYKESITETGSKVYTNVKSKAVSLYLDITASVCASDQELCETAKEDLKNLKESISLTWDFIREITGVGINKLKSWYEVWRSL